MFDEPWLDPADIPIYFASGFDKVRRPDGDDDSWRPAYKAMEDSVKTWESIRLAQQEAEYQYHLLWDRWDDARRMVEHQRNGGSPDFTWEQAFILLGLGY